jgi:DNA-binding MarR family transcriptional regulator
MIYGKNVDMKTSIEPAERDHVDDLLESLRGLPAVDLEVEGILDRIIGLSRRIRRSMEETLREEFDLTHGEFKVLGWLRTGDRSPGELAANADLSSGAMTNRLDQLERAGLVERRPDPDDRRGIRVSATEKGRQTWIDAFAAQAEKEKRMAATLDPEEKAQLNTLLRRLTLAFERAASGDVPPGC